MLLVCHVISQNRKIKGSRDFIVKVSYHSAKFGDYRDSGSFSCNLAKPRDQSNIWLHGLKLLKISHYPTKFSSLRHCSSGDIIGFSL